MLNINRGKLLQSPLTALSIAITLAGACAAEAKPLVVYSALDEAQMVELLAAFKAEHPDINVEVINESGGTIVARLIAEKSNPRADILFGAPVSGLMALNGEGILQPYKPNGFDDVKPALKDTASPVPLWVGLDAWASAVCYNTVEGKAEGAPQPTKWVDLVKPEYKGKVVMTNPNSSGTGFLTVAGWLTLFGEKGAWDYMDKLNENVSQYVSSGETPCRMAASGEAVVGISYAFPGVQAKNEGAPIDVVLPAEGLGSEIEATALIKGGANSEAAKLLADFAASSKAGEISSKYYAVVAHNGSYPTVPNYPEGEEKLMLNIDFNQLSAQKPKILAEWQRRYGAKATE
ncbi:extracellular solute-binding protein [Agrobacterium tumefaciens]|uniref:extracellular solute-binding protein n=1 Tax=Agrobacterium tumefaciens TaxID=358 RepID=UPI001573F8BF|nr:extracellular solute-binding protein [Agrobacterium tumefaciens]NTE65533.1 extracellular solute-binding protein [Agrobacterium tumefaciens]